MEYSYFLIDTCVQNQEYFSFFCYLSPNTLNYIFAATLSTSVCQKRPELREIIKINALQFVRQRRYNTAKNYTTHANAIVRFICRRKSCAISPKMPQTEHNTTTTDCVKLQQTEDGACLVGVVGTATMKRCRMRIAPLSTGGFERRDERAAGAHRPPRRGGVPGGAGQAAFQPVPQPQPKWQPQLRRVSSAETAPASLRPRRCRAF